MKYVVNFSLILEEKSFFLLRKHVNVCSNNTFCIRTPFTLLQYIQLLSPSTLGLRVNQKSLPKYLLTFGGPYIHLSTTYAKKRIKAVSWEKGNRQVDQIAKAMEQVIPQ